jgi:hypothetical protein
MSQRADIIVTWMDQTQEVYHARSYERGSTQLTFETDNQADLGGAPPRYIIPLGSSVKVVRIEET